MEAIDSNPSSQQVLPKKRSMAPKAKQLRFSKTKKRKRPTITLPKPSYAEVKVSQRTLSHIEPKFCAICFSEDDKSYNEQVEWIPNVPCGCIVCVWVQTRNRTLPGFVHAARSNIIIMFFSSLHVMSTKTQAGDLQLPSRSVPGSLVSI